MIFKTRAWLGISAVLVLTLGLSQVQARDAAFMDPAATNNNPGGGAISVEPKGDIDTGESILNVARRTTVFFVNQTSLPVQVEKMTVNGDGNVAAEITSDDCTKQGSIPPQSRCSVEVAVTPSSPGTWSVDVLMTHNGAGRIARSKLTGKTTGSTASNERKDTGLALNTKEASPVSFGDVEVGAKSVRSALMVNDSPDNITLYSIDVIEAENGLQRLDQGCAVDMELKPGESCPVTLVWTPTGSGQISTDLIIRHSGRLGFAVIPIRGSAKGATQSNSKGEKSIVSDGSKVSLPPPPSAQELERAAAGHIPAISAEALGAAPASGVLRLIGTVGNRAVLLKSDGTTAVVGVGEEFDDGERKDKLLVLTAKSASVLVNGKKRELILGAAPELTDRARNKDAASAAGVLSGSAGVPVASSPVANSPAPVAQTLGAPLGSGVATSPQQTSLLPAVPGAAK